jgi:hypothetical protein
VSSGVLACGFAFGVLSAGKGNGPGQHRQLGARAREQLGGYRRRPGRAGTGHQFAARCHGGRAVTVSWSPAMPRMVAAGTDIDRVIQRVITRSPASSPDTSR